MGLRRPALLGNSFGCQIIIDLVARHPERIGCAILQGPTAPAKERTWLMQAVRWRQNQPFNPPSLGPVTWGDYRKCGWIRLFRTFHYSLLDPIEAKLPKVACPALVVRGANDPICRADWAEYVAHRLPQGRLALIPEVAHTLRYTAPAELADVSRAFLRELARAPRVDEPPHRTLVRRRFRFRLRHGPGERMLPPRRRLPGTGAVAPPRAAGDR